MSKYFSDFSIQTVTNWLYGSSAEPNFHLIAELKSDGWLKFNPKRAANLRSNSEDVEIAVISIVEDQLDGEARMIDFVHDLLLEAENPESNSQHERFPLQDPKLQDKNGILMQAKPFVLDTNRVTSYPRKPIKKVVYLMTIWIGDRSKLDHVGFTKLADFLYYTSSFVIHSTTNVDQPDTTKQFLWKGSYAHSIQDRALRQICFMFFNWPYGQDQDEKGFRQFGFIDKTQFAEWADRSPVAAACQGIINKFQYSQVYCFDTRKTYEAAGIIDLPSMLNHHQFQFELQSQTTKLPWKYEFYMFVANINKHKYQDPFFNGLKPFKSSQIQGHYQPKQSKPGRKPNHQPVKKQTLAQTVDNYQFYLDNLFVEGPTTDPTKLDNYHRLAVLQIVEDPSILIDGNLEAKLQSEWNRITQCIAQLDLELVNVESEFVLLLMSPDATKEKLDSFIADAREKLQDLNPPLTIHNNGINPFLRTCCNSLLEKMTLIVATMTDFNKALNQVNGYLQQETIDEEHEKAVSKFTDRNSFLDSMAVIVLDNMCNLIKIQNDSLKQKAAILASEARQAATEEYCKSMDRLMEKAVYSKASLVESHERVVKSIVDTFSAEDYQNKVWRDMVTNLKADLEAHVTTLLERNWINSKAAFERYENIMAFANEIYQESLGPDYKNFSGKRKQRAHDDARRSALRAFRDKVENEPQAWISQWYQDVHDRIELESPNATLAAAFHPFVDPEEERLKELLKSCIAEMEAKFLETELARFVKLSVRKAMDDAKQVLEADDLSAQKLKLTLSKLNLRRPCLDMSVVAVD